MKKPVCFIKKDAKTTILVSGEAPSAETAALQVISELGLPSDTPWSETADPGIGATEILIFVLARPRPIAAAVGDGRGRSEEEAAKHTAVKEASKAFWDKHEAAQKPAVGAPTYTPSFTKRGPGGRNV